jgi:Na+:H+ antiporter, NhaA family
MTLTPQFTLSNLFSDFFKSEKIGGLILILCTGASLAISNSGWGQSYIHFWHAPAFLSVGKIELNFSVEEWINDGLMAIFFLMVGLEIERELYMGELSKFSNALLPILAAIGGMVLPAVIHFGFNRATASQPGIGIPMATDIAFSLGVLSLLGKRVPAALKIFLTAVAIIDDLGAVIIIAVFYTKGFSLTNLVIALGIFGFLLALNKLNVLKTWIYLVFGVVMWYFMQKSGVHATISGVLLAFAIPFRKDGGKNPSHALQHGLHNPVNFLIIPLFALANTGIHLASGWHTQLGSGNSLGIMIGLLAGKPLGICLMCLGGVGLKWCQLPEGISWRSLWGAAILAGIGFTMSIFITNLAFVGNPDLIENSKIAVLLGSIAAACLGFIWLALAGGKGKKYSGRKTSRYSD